VVDLGQMDNVLPVQMPRHSSLPPVMETRTWHVGEHSFAEGRHRSLPLKMVTISAASPAIEDSETDGETNGSVKQPGPLSRKGKKTAMVSYL
jgi:hypothetical protein